MGPADFGLVTAWDEALQTSLELYQITHAWVPVTNTSHMRSYQVVERAGMEVVRKHDLTAAPECVQVGCSTQTESPDDLQQPIVFFLGAHHDQSHLPSQRAGHAGISAMTQRRHIRRLAQLTIVTLCASSMRPWPP